MAIGCCGNRSVSLQGLLAEADFYPATSPQGRAARAKLAYSIAAGRAAQVGNRPAYERAMKSLSGLGDGTVTTGYHGTTADAAAAAQSIHRIAQQTQAQISRDLATAGTYINLVLGAAQIGTGLGAAFCNGCNRSGIDAVNLVISIVRSVITPGSSLTVPTLSVDALNGLVGFCAFKDAIKGGIQVAFGLGSTAARVANNGSAATALDTINNYVANLMDAICNIPQVQIALAAAAAPPPDAPPATPSVPMTQSSLCWDGSTTTQTWDPATQRWGASTPPCPARPPARGLETGVGGCGPGLFNMWAPAGVPDGRGGVLPATAGRKNCVPCHSPATYVPGVVNAQGFWVTPPRCVAPAHGAGTGGASSASSGGLLKVAVPAAAALWWFFK